VQYLPGSLVGFYPELPGGNDKGFVDGPGNFLLARPASCLTYRRSQTQGSRPQHGAFNEFSSCLHIASLTKDKDKPIGARFVIKLTNGSSMSTFLTMFVLSLFCSTAIGQSAKITSTMDKSSELDTATFAAGCSWCVEAIFQSLEGVELVRSGYSGGHVPNPSYEEVCTGVTGHAEVTRIVYNPKII